MKHIFSFEGVGICFETKWAKARTHLCLCSSVMFSSQVCNPEARAAVLLAQSYILMFSEPKLWERDPSQWPRVPGLYLDMLACHRLLKKSVDAPEVNENIWFLPELFTSQLGHMSWQVTRVLRRIGDRSGGLLLFFHTGCAGHSPETQRDMFLAQKADKDWPASRWNSGCILAFYAVDLFHLLPVSDSIVLEDSLFLIILLFLLWFLETDLTSCHHLISTSAITSQSPSSSHGEVWLQLKAQGKC